jgi:hypothetical protein
MVSNIQIGNVPISVYIQNLINSQLSNPNSKVFSNSKKPPASSSSAVTTKPPTPPAPPSPPPQVPPPASTTFSATTTTSKPASSVTLPFDPTTMSPGEAYARIARLDNDELSITPREQLAATDILNSGYYKQTAVYGNNIVFLSNPNQSSPIDDKALREVNAMSRMPGFQEMFKSLDANGEKVVVMVSNYGPSFAAGNVDLTDKNGKKLNVITLDPNYIDFDHTNPNKRNVTAALSNELHEVLSRMHETQQKADYVGTRPFQESTLAVDQLMEDYINSFVANNRVNYTNLSPYDRGRVLSFIGSWPPEMLASNLQKNLNAVNNQGGYSRFGQITDQRTANLAAVELNKKLEYIIGSTPKVQFSAQLQTNGTYNFSVKPVQNLA